MSHEDLQREFLRLAEQSVWANLQWVEVVYAASEPEARPRELLAHLMVGDRAWFERIEGEQRTTAMFPLLSEDQLVRGFAENRDAVRRLIESRLEDVVHFRRASGEEYHARVADIIHHLVTHGYHHRGQLAAHYARGGMKYPNTDHINFLIRNKL
ncbi:MAG TPA: DinB family protein [Gemmatimonadales bacterium]|nr:DinB family protein [Gemmatimonadales bacterium]